MKDSQTFGRILDGAFNAGYRHVQLDADHNDVTISSALKRWIPSTLQREDIFVSVKVSNFHVYFHFHVLILYSEKSS